MLILAGLALGSGAGWARWFTVVAASINVLAQLLWQGSTGWPLWTLAGISFSIIVIYALTARWEGYAQTVR